MLRRNVFLPLALSVFIALSVGAAKQLNFLAPSALNVMRLLPDPPTLNSEEGGAEIDTLLHLSRHRTDAQKARILNEDEFSVFTFADVIGPWFTADNCPKTAAFFDKVIGDTKIFTNIAKKHWARPRPYISVPTLQTFGQREKSDSYPSGHSTRATVCAEILAQIFPDKRTALLERGRQIGWDRVIGGLHYPSDIAAGRVLGHALVKEFLASPEFNSDLAAVQAELQSATHTATTQPAAATAP
ncbi:MAG: phosphatase PAP2 family protein [Tepidisphaeraceae bacterium]|jgi:acid phosphatase (class A)